MRMFRALGSVHTGNAEHGLVLVEETLSNNWTSSEQNMAWYWAQRHCQTIGRRLITIKNEQDQLSLNRFLLNKERERDAL